MKGGSITSSTDTKAEKIKGAGNIARSEKLRREFLQTEAALVRETEGYRRGEKAKLAAALRYEAGACTQGECKGKLVRK